MLSHKPVYFYNLIFFPTTANLLQAHFSIRLNLLAILTFTIHRHLHIPQNIECPLPQLQLPPQHIKIPHCIPLGIQLRLRISIPQIRKAIPRIRDIEILPPRLLQRLEPMEPRSRPDSSDRAVALAIFEPATAGSAPGCALEQLVRVDGQVGGCGGGGRDSADRGALHVCEDFEHVARVPFNDREEGAMGGGAIRADEIWGRDLDG